MAASDYHVKKCRGLNRVLSPLPPLAEQKRIAGILKEQLAAVERRGPQPKPNSKPPKSSPPRTCSEVFEGDQARKWESCRLGDLIEALQSHDSRQGIRRRRRGRVRRLEHVESNTGRRTGSLTLGTGALSRAESRHSEGQIIYGYLRPYLNKVWIAEFDGCLSVDHVCVRCSSRCGPRCVVRCSIYAKLYVSEIVPPWCTQTGRLPRISIDEILSVRIARSSRR